MLPVFTTQQVKDGIDYSDLMLDLSDYMKKKDAATKTELETLTAVVANKLDKQPQHKHIIEDVDQLQTVLDTKFNENELGNNIDIKVVNKKKESSVKIDENITIFEEGQNNIILVYYSVFENKESYF